MGSLSFPDMNVWLALATSEHVHSAEAHRWWAQQDARIAFTRFTQMSFLRLMTTAAAMDGEPLTLTQAWRVYDRFYDDDRATFLPEPAGIEKLFRQRTAGRTASPKMWADGWLLAFAEATEGVLVTFDKALGPRGALPARSVIGTPRALPFGNKSLRCTSAST